MHASILLAFALLSSAFVLATPIKDTHPHLARRQLNPISLGIASAGVDINRENRNRIDEVRGRLRQIRDNVTFLKGREQMLQGGPRLARRQLGTVVGAVGIHQSKENRDMINDLRNQLPGLQADVDWLLQMEHLSRSELVRLGDMGHQEFAEIDHAAEVEELHEDEEFMGPEESGPVDESSATVTGSSDGSEHHLERRFLGIILGPIAFHQAKEDRDMLEDLRRHLDALNADCARVRTAQEARLRLGGAGGLASTSVTVASGFAGNRFPTPPFLSSSIPTGVLGSSTDRHHNDGWVTGPTMHGSGFGPRSGSGRVHHASTSYGRPRRY